MKHQNIKIYSFLFIRVEYERIAGLLIQGTLNVNQPVNGGTLLHVIAAAGKPLLLILNFG